MNATAKTTTPRAGLLSVILFLLIFSVSSASEGGPRYDYRIDLNTIEKNRFQVELFCEDFGQDTLVYHFPWMIPGTYAEANYGKFIHKQELAFIASCQVSANDTSLSLGCGTGRFMEFCTHGYDISNKMIDEARLKFPNKIFTVGCASNTPYLDHSFDNIICLHVIMHLSQTDTNNLINEALRLLKPERRPGPMFFPIQKLKDY